MELTLEQKVHASAWIAIPRRCPPQRIEPQPPGSCSSEPSYASAAGFRRRKTSLSGLFKMPTCSPTEPSCFRDPAHQKGMPMVLNNADITREIVLRGTVWAGAARVGSRGSTITGIEARHRQDLRDLPRRPGAGSAGAAECSTTCPLRCRLQGPAHAHVRTRSGRKPSFYLG